MTMLPSLCKKMNIRQMLFGMLFWLRNVTLGDVQFLLILQIGKIIFQNRCQGSWIEVHDGRKFLKVISKETLIWEDRKEEETWRKHMTFFHFGLPLLFCLESAWQSTTITLPEQGCGGPEGITDKLWGAPRHVLLIVHTLLQASSWCLKSELRTVISFICFFNQLHDNFISPKSH